MLKCVLKSVKNSSSENSSSSNSDDHQNKDVHGLLPVKMYIVIFLVLLAMIFINIGISKLPITGFWITFALISVSIVQTILVAVFFMELIHEDKFYSFVFGSAILFMLLFFTITLGDLRGRDFFHKDEGVKVMRGIDQNGNYAPGGPKLDREKK